MGLLDVLQSASNAVAGNVAGPVDLLSFLLRKGGVPVPEDALGGSEWMKRKGLMRDVPKGAEQVVGETLGLLAPTAIAANAPKIARGLLQAQANAAAPKTLHPETGAIVWHGSPHKFDRFDSSKMGTGEGAQAYGAGTYLAESPKVAKQYQKELATEVTLDGKPYFSAGKQVASTGNSTIDDFLTWHVGDVDAALDAAKRMGFDEHLPQLEALRKRVQRVQGGALYKVDLPDEFIPRMLDWDKPLSQQPHGKTLQELGARIADDYGMSGFGPTLTPSGTTVYRALDDAEYGGQWIEAAQRAIRGNPIRRVSTSDSLEAARLLREAGIPGIRYLDGGSRGAGQGTSNFVIFPGLEDQLKILERNGVPLGLLTP